MKKGKKTNSSMDPLLAGPAGRQVTLALKKVGVGSGGLDPQDSFFLDLGMKSLQWIEFWSILNNKTKAPREEADFLHIETVGEAIHYLRGDPVKASAKNHHKKITEKLNWLLNRNSNGTSPKKFFPHPFSRKIFLNFFRELSKRWAHLEIQGLENLPKKGPYILTPNHESHLDNLFIASLLPRHIQRDMAVLAKKEHFENPLTRLWAQLCNAIPVDRNHVTLEDLKTCKDLLSEGKILMIHPEGTRSPDGRLLPFKPGAALLAQETQSKLIPIYIEGAHELWPKNRALPHLRGHIKIKIDRPLSPLPVDRKKSQKSPLDQAKDLNKKLRQRIEKLAKNKN